MIQDLYFGKMPEIGLLRLVELISLHYDLLNVFFDLLVFKKIRLSVHSMIAILALFKIYDSVVYSVHRRDYMVLITVLIGVQIFQDKRIGHGILEVFLRRFFVGIGFEKVVNSMLLNFVGFLDFSFNIFLALIVKELIRKFLTHANLI